MQATTDNYLVSDLAEFSRAGGATPFGANYSFQYLWDSLQRRVTENDKITAIADREKARSKDMQAILEEAKRAREKNKGGNKNNNGPAALAADGGLTKNDKKLLTKAKAEQAQSRAAKGGGQQQEATMPAVTPTEEAPRRTRSERRKASKTAKALAGADEAEDNAFPAGKRRRKRQRQERRWKGRRQRWTAACRLPGGRTAAA